MHAGAVPASTRLKNGAEQDAMRTKVAGQCAKLCIESDQLDSPPRCLSDFVVMRARMDLKTHLEPRAAAEV